ncbi:MAG: flagellar basal body P-ring protein FlgI [Pirellulales bacterium]
MQFLNVRTSRSQGVKCITALVACCMIACAIGSASAQETLKLRDICRLKGQEENTLQGLGLVVGLKGTGDDASKPTARALARMVQLMGGQIGNDAQGQVSLAEIEESKNVALVFVTVEVPPAGAQQGDKLDCNISAIGAKSLEGGTLMLTPLLGPRPDRPVVYALAQGQILIPDTRVPTSARITQGCKMEATIRNEFVANNKITLILDRDMSSFNTAQNIEDTINDLNSTMNGGVGNKMSNQESAQLAQAQDATHIEVTIPQYYRDQPVKFVSLIMDMEFDVSNVRNRKCVVINERDQSIAVGDDVLIAPVAISHKNLSIEARGGLGGFVGLDVASGNQLRPKLKNLVDALKSLNVPTSDQITIIKTLKRKGDLYGELILE